MTETATHIISARALEAVIFTDKNNHGAAFTVRSKLTGKDYTYKISRSQYQHNWYTHVKVETGYMQFTRVGAFKDGFIVKDRQCVNTPAAIAAGWLLRHVVKKDFDTLDQSVDIMHFGKCLVCGRDLTDAESIEAGLGPVCRGRIKS